MKRKKLAIIGGLLVLLLLSVNIIAGCNSNGNNQGANPLESISPTTTPEGNGNRVQEFNNHGDGEDEGPSLNLNGEKFLLADFPGYPAGNPVATGIVRKVTGTTLDIESPTGVGAVGFQGGKFTGETKTTQIIFNRDTKVYKWVDRVGAKPPVELKESSINDISEGRSITVWGEESGTARITATTIIIESGNSAGVVGGG
jgi:hypothetical protein